MVANRHFHMTHGMGRSGDVNAVQPKAAGSSLLVKLTAYLLADAIKIMGVSEYKAKNTCMLPLCTGLSLTLVFSLLS